MNQYFLASSAALAFAAAVVLALFSLPKPTVAPQCSDCDYVIKGPVAAYVNFSYPRNYTKAYLLWGNASARSSIIGEYAWSYPLLITCNDYMFAHVRGGILYATCGSGSISIIRNWYSGPFNTGNSGSGGNRPRYLKIWIYARVWQDGYMYLKVYVNSNAYTFTAYGGLFVEKDIRLWYDLQAGVFLTKDPGGMCVNATIKSVDKYENPLSYKWYVDYLTVSGPGPMFISGARYTDVVEFWGDGYNAEYGVRIALDGAPDVVVTHIDRVSRGEMRGADIYWIQLCS